MLLCLSLLGCDDAVIETIENQGVVCLRQSDEGAPVEVQVRFDTCLSGNCDSQLEAMCEVSLEGAELRVHSQAAIERREGSCHDDCQLIMAHCSLPELPPGDYDLVHGDARVAAATPLGNTALGEDSACR